MALWYLWVSPFLCDFAGAQEFHDVLGSLGHGRLYPGVVAQLLHPQVQGADDGLVWRGKARSRLWHHAPRRAMLAVTASKQGLTDHVIALKAQLAGLAGLEDLHPDEFNFRLAVLEHLLRRR